MVDVARLEIQADSSSVKTAGQNLAGFSQKATLATRAMRVLAPVMAAALSARLFSNFAFFNFNKVSNIRTFKYSRAWSKSCVWPY